VGSRGGGTVYRSIWAEAVFFLDVSPQGLEAGMVEASDGVHVAGDWANGKVFVASGNRLGNHLVNQLSTDPSATKALGDHDGLHLPVPPVIEKARQPHDPSFGLSDPGGDSLWRRQVGVESRSWVVASDRVVLIDPSMLFSQFDPQRPAGCVVARDVTAHADAESG